MIPALPPTPPALVSHAIPPLIGPYPPRKVALVATRTARLGWPHEVLVTRGGQVEGALICAEILRQSTLQEFGGVASCLPSPTVGVRYWRARVTIPTTTPPQTFVVGATVRRDGLVRVTP